MHYCKIYFSFLPVEYNLHSKQMHWWLMLTRHIQECLLTRGGYQIPIKISLWYLTIPQIVKWTPKIRILRFCGTLSLGCGKFLQFSLLRTQSLCWKVSFQQANIKRFPNTTRQCYYLLLPHGGLFCGSEYLIDMYQHKYEC